MLSVKLEYTSSEKTAESVAELLRNVQRSDALSKLSLVVPRREVVESTWEEHRFRRAQEDTDAEESAIRLGGSGAC